MNQIRRRCIKGRLAYLSVGILVFLFQGWVYAQPVSLFAPLVNEHIGSVQSIEFDATFLSAPPQNISQIPGIKKDEPVYELSVQAYFQKKLNHLIAEPIVPSNGSTLILEPLEQIKQALLKINPEPLIQVVLPTADQITLWLLDWQQDYWSLYPQRDSYQHSEYGLVLIHAPDRRIKRVVFSEGGVSSSDDHNVFPALLREAIGDELADILQAYAYFIVKNSQGEWVLITGSNENQVVINLQRFYWQLSLYFEQLLDQLLGEHITHTSGWNRAAVFISQPVKSDKQDKEPSDPSGAIVSQGKDTDKNDKVASVPVIGGVVVPVVEDLPLKEELAERSPVGSSSNSDTSLAEYTKQFAEACSNPMHKESQTRIKYVKHGYVRAEGYFELHPFISLAAEAVNVPFVEELLQHNVNMLAEDIDAGIAIDYFISEQWAKHPDTVKAAFALAGKQLGEKTNLESWLSSRLSVVKEETPNRRERIILHFGKKQLADIEEAALTRKRELQKSIYECEVLVEKLAFEESVLEPDEKSEKGEDVYHAWTVDIYEQKTKACRERVEGLLTKMKQSGYEGNIYAEKVDQLKSDLKDIEEEQQQVVKLLRAIHRTVNQFGSQHDPISDEQAEKFRQLVTELNAARPKKNEPMNAWDLPGRLSGLERRKKHLEKQIATSVKNKKAAMEEKKKAQFDYQRMAALYDKLAQKQHDEWGKAQRFATQSYTLDEKLRQLKNEMDMVFWEVRNEVKKGERALRKQAQALPLKETLLETNSALEEQKKSLPEQSEEGEEDEIQPDEGD